MTLLWPIFTAVWLWAQRTGHPWKGAILVVWGAAVVGQIDNVVRYVISGRAKMHSLLVFFALLGGVKAFGVLAARV